MKLQKILETGGMKLSDNLLIHPAYQNHDLMLDYCIQQRQLILISLLAEFHHQAIEQQTFPFLVIRQQPSLLFGISSPPFEKHSLSLL